MKASLTCEDLADLSGSSLEAVDAVEAGRGGQRLDRLGPMGRVFGLSLVGLVFGGCSGCSVSGGGDVGPNRLRFGREVSRLRVGLGLSTAELGAGTQKGWCWVERLERGEVDVTLEQVPSLARTLRVSARELLGVWDGVEDGALEFESNGGGSERVSHTRELGSRVSFEMRAERDRAGLARRFTALRRHALVPVSVLSERGGLSPSALRALERGRSAPKVSMVERACRAYGLRISEVVGGVASDGELRELGRAEVARSKKGLGALFRRWREARGLPRRELGAAIGMTETRLSKLEHGDLGLDVEELVALCGELGLSVGSVLLVWECELCWDDDSVLEAGVPMAEEGGRRVA